MKRYFPLGLDVEGCRCVVVGGGEVAARKARALAEHGAEVWVVSPRLGEELQRMQREGRLHWVRRDYREGDLEGARLAVAATGSRAVNARVAGEGKRRGVLVNVVDSPAESDFIVPAVVRRGSLWLAVSTGGKLPMLARRLREELETSYGSEYARWVEFLGEVRHRIQQQVSDSRSRRLLLEKIVYSPALDLLREGKEEEARRLVEEILAGSPRGGGGY